MSARPGHGIVGEDVQAILDAQLPWGRLAGRTLAVTGATGFIGSYFVRTLLALNDAGKVEQPVTVIAIVRDLDKARSRFVDLLSHPQFRLERGDLAVPGDLDVQADWFIHAASPASPKYYGPDPVGTIAPNVIGTWRLLELARAQRSEGVLFLSTSEVYGAVGDAAVLAEDSYGPIDPVSPRSVYAEGKRMGETLCTAWMRQHGVPVFIVRPFHTYGPGVDLADGRVFADFAADVLHGRDISMSSDGSARRAFCYITDAMAGFFHVMLKGEQGLPYNVANPAGDLSVRELAELMVSLFPDKGLKVSRQGSPLGAYLASPHACLLPSVERISALGWRPVVAPATGFRRMVESYA